MENNHTFPSPDEKDTENIENKKPEESQTRQNGEEKAAGDGSYEIVFGSQNGGDSRYSANGYNAYGLNANGSSYRGGAEASAGSAEKSTYTPRFSEGKKNKKQTRVTVMLTLSVVFLAISVMLSAMTIYLLRKNNPQYTLKSPTGDSGNITPWVNPSELQYEDAYANAASKAVDSVVMISATTQNSTSMRGSFFPLFFRRRMPSMMAMAPDRSSAARMVLPSVTTFPSRTLGLTLYPLDTRSI